MAEGFFIKTLVELKKGGELECFLPAGGEATSIFQRIKMGVMVRCDIRVPRNYKHLKLYKVLLRTVFDNLPHRRHNAYPTEESLEDAIKMEVGCFKTYVELRTAEIRRYPGSIAFHKMGQVEFDEFYRRVCDLVIAEFYPDMTSQDLRREIESLTGIRMEE